MRKKCFGLFFVLLFLFILVGCTKNIKYTHFKTSDNIDYFSKKPTVILSLEELSTYVGDKNMNEVSKYTNDFFEDNMLIVFIVPESSFGNKSSLVGYDIKNEIIEIYIETEHNGVGAEFALSYFALELEENQKSIKEIKIYKDGKSIYYNY